MENSLRQERQGNQKKQGKEDQESSLKFTRIALEFHYLQGGPGGNPFPEAF